MKTTTGMSHRQAHEHVVGVDGNEVALCHRHRIHVVIAERFDELLADHRGCRCEPKLVEQEVHDAGGEIGNAYATRISIPINSPICHENLPATSATTR
jgi:hypothetical protein